MKTKSDGNHTYPKIENKRVGIQASNADGNKPATKRMVVMPINLIGGVQYFLFSKR